MMTLYRSGNGKFREKFFVLHYFCVALHPKFSVLCAEDIVRRLKNALIRHRARVLYTEFYFC